MLDSFPRLDLAAAALAALGAIAVLIRNIFIYNVSVALVEDSEAFARLPTYEAMLFKPCYWHLWTAHQWIEATK